MLVTNKARGICYKLPVCSTHLLYNYHWVENQSDKRTRPRTTVRNSDAQVCIVWEYNFDTFEQSSFQKYATYWVFLALRHMLYLCIL